MIIAPNDSGYLTIERKPQRDHWKRPLVYPPGYVPNPDDPREGKVAYTRCTKYIDVIEDEFSLKKWVQRQVLRGIALRPDLYAMACAQGPQPDKVDAYDHYADWRGEMDGIAWKCTSTAKSDEKANIGDALHKFTERLDRGLSVEPSEVPDKYHQHLRNYMAATAGMMALHVERFMVCDELNIGGTPDRLLIEEGSDRIVIGDVKTGNVDYTPEKIARQLAVYAHSEIYDDQTGRRWLPGELDQQWGVIIHLDARSGLVRLIDVNLEEGWQGVLECQRVRAERNRKVTTREHYAPGAPVLPNREEVTPETMQAIRTAIGAAGDEEALDAIWQAAAHLWEESLTTAVQQRLEQLRIRGLYEQPATAGV